MGQMGHHFWIDHMGHDGSLTASDPLTHDEITAQ